MRDVMSPEQVAEYLQLSAETIYSLIEERTLAATKIGSAYRIRSQDVEQFLRTHGSLPEVRAVLFRQVLAIAERNPGVSSDEVLEELEAMDDERKRARSHTG